MTTLKKFSLPDPIERLVLRGFSFLGNERLIGVNYDDYKKYALVFHREKLFQSFPCAPRSKE
jgi:hypothetical protein